MTQAEVLVLLKRHADARGQSHWLRMAHKSSLKSFGIGLTLLRKLAKQIGRDHRLALKLWESDWYDARVISLLIDDPKQLTREQAESQVQQLGAGMLSHVFASCDSTLSKTPFAFELAKDWMPHHDPVRRRCGYNLLYELTKKNPKGMDDAFLLERIEHIRNAIHAEEMWVREAMNTALMGIGKRNLALNKAAIRAARAIGKIDIDYGPDNACEPLDVLKHLTSEYVTEKLSGKAAR